VGGELHFNFPSKKKTQGEGRKTENSLGNVCWSSAKVARSSPHYVTKCIDRQLPLCYKKLGIPVMFPISIVRNSKLQAFGASKEVNRKFSENLIRLRRRPRALPVDECVRGVGAKSEPRYHCFGGFRHWRITLRSPGACVPKRFGAHGRRRVFLWRYHGLSPWGSIESTYSTTMSVRWEVL